MSADLSLTTLLRDLISEVSLLIRQEFRLVQAETAQKIVRVRSAVIAMAAALLLAGCALLILLQAAIIALAELMPAWAASVLIGVVLAVAAFILFRFAQSGLSPANLVPDRTLDALQRDKDLVMEKVQS